MIPGIRGDQWTAGYNLTLYQARTHVCAPPDPAGPTPPPLGALWVCTCGLRWEVSHDPAGGQAWRMETLRARLRRWRQRRRSRRAELDTMHRRVLVVPGVRGWSNRAARATYEEIAEDLVHRGINPEYVAAALRLSYLAAESDVTEWQASKR